MASPTPTAPRLSTAVIVAGILVVAGFVAPALYGFVAFHGDYWRMFKPMILRHVGFNSFANLLVMLGSLNLVGRIDQKLSNILLRTLIVHGTLAFLTLVTRHYYSIPMLLTAVPFSAGTGAGVALIRQRASAARVGLIGPWHWIGDDRALACHVIASPEEPIAAYQLILITFEGELPAAWTPMLSRALLAGKPVRHVAEYLEEARGVVAIEHFEIDHLPETGLVTYRTPKRLLDVLFVAAALPFAAPVVALAALGIAISMGRPILFAQPRVGLGGVIFRMYKLRTMRADTGAAVAAATARQDHRITPLGHWLRRFRIDELPQFFNVLVGDMSLIGPRPEQPALASRYAAEVPAFVFRQMVRPGITGWAQVMAGYAADLAETRIKLAYDLFYLKNFSFGLDARILVRTVWTLLSGRGVR